jgi:hypothetical protein
MGTSVLVLRPTQVRRIQLDIVGAGPHGFKRRLDRDVHLSHRMDA